MLGTFRWARGHTGSKPAEGGALGAKLKVYYLARFSGIFQTFHSQSGREGGGRSHLLLTLAIRAFTAHPHRDGAPILLLLETPATFGLSLRVFHTYTFFRLSYPLPVWPAVATIYLPGQRSFSRYYQVYQTFPCMPLSCIFPISPTSSYVPHCAVRILSLFTGEFLCFLHCTKGTYVRRPTTECRALTHSQR